jgi:acyl dehydratase
MEDIYFEDVVPEIELRAEASYVIPEQELIDFAATWDPLPIHTDKAFAAQHGGLTAAGTYLLAVKMKLIHALPLRRTVMASIGYDQLRFHKPAHPNDTLFLKLKWIEKRRSQSKPDRGIVTIQFFLLNAADEVILSHLDTVIMRLRNPEAA